MISSSPSTDALWLDTLNRIAGRAAHELKGVLNGVSVNLEVVRSRSAKPDTAASAVASFSASAATQFDAVIDMTEALLALARRATGPADAGQVVRWVAALLGPVARVDGRDLAVDGSVSDLGTVSADPGAVRMAIGAVLLGAIESARRVVCRADDRTLRVEGTDGEPGRPADEIVAAAREAGIQIQAERSAISITFPR